MKCSRVAIRRERLRSALGGVVSIVLGLRSWLAIKPILVIGHVVESSAASAMPATLLERLRFASSLVFRVGFPAEIF